MKGAALDVPDQLWLAPLEIKNLCEMVPTGGQFVQLIKHILYFPLIFISLRHIAQVLESPDMRNIV